MVYELVRNGRGEREEEQSVQEENVELEDPAATDEPQRDAEAVAQRQQDDADDT